MTRAGCVGLAPGVRTAALPPIRYSLSLTCIGVYSSAGCGSLAYFSVSQRPGDCCARTVNVARTRVAERAAVVRRVAAVMGCSFDLWCRRPNALFNRARRANTHNNMYVLLACLNAWAGVDCAGTQAEHSRE